MIDYADEFLNAVHLYDIKPNLQERQKKPNVAAYRADSGVNIADVDPDLMDSFARLAADFQNIHGRPIRITSGRRTKEQQEKIYATARPGYAAKPGYSRHEFGAAFDVHKDDAQLINKMDLASYGLESGAKWKRSEPWHIQLMKWVMPGEAQAAEVPQSKTDYASELLGSNLSSNIQQDYSSQMLNEQRIGRPDKEMDIPIGEPSKGSPSFLTMVQAAIVDDPKTKFKILAKDRFPQLSPEAGAKRYFIKDKDIYFIDDQGMQQKEIGSDFGDKVKNVLAEYVIGMSPEILGGGIGEILGGPFGAGIGTMLGGQAKKEAARLIYDEPQTFGERAITGVTDFAGGTGGALTGKMIGKGISRVGRTGTGKVGKLLAKDYETFDPALSRELLALGKQYNINLTAPEITNSPTLRAVWANLAKTPGKPAEKIARFIQETRNPQVLSAIQRELATISPEDSIFKSGGLAKEAAELIKQGLEDARRTATKKLYDTAFETGSDVRVNPVIDRLNELIIQQPETGTGLTALNKIKRLMYRTAKDDTGKDVLIPETRLRQLQGVKEEIDALLKRTQSGQEAIPKKIHRNLADIKNNLLSAMDDASADYKAARQTYESYSKPLNDLLYGKPDIKPQSTQIKKTIIGRLMNMGDENLDKAPDIIFGKSSSPEAIKRTRDYFVKNGHEETWNAIVRARLQEALTVTVKDTTLMEGNFGYAFRKGVMGNAMDRLKWKTALTQGQYKSLENLMTVLDQTQKIVYTNSQTAYQLAADEMLKKESGRLLAKILTKMTFSPRSVGETIEKIRYPRFANAVVDALMNPENAAKISKLRQLSNTPMKTLEVIGMIEGELAKKHLSIIEDVKPVYNQEDMQ